MVSTPVLSSTPPFIISQQTKNYHRPQCPCVKNIYKKNQPFTIFLGKRYFWPTGTVGEMLLCSNMCLLQPLAWGQTLLNNHVISKNRHSGGKTQVEARNRQGGRSRSKDPPSTNPTPPSTEFLKIGTRGR